MLNKIILGLLATSIPAACAYPSISQLETPPKVDVSVNEEKAVPIKIVKKTWNHWRVLGSLLPGDEIVTKQKPRHLGPEVIVPRERHDITTVRPRNHMRRPDIGRSPRRRPSGWQAHEAPDGQGSRG